MPQRHNWSVHSDIFTLYVDDSAGRETDLDPHWDVRAELAAESILAAERIMDNRTPPLPAPAQHAIKSALVTSRLTLSDADAGHNPYENRLGRLPGNPWRDRVR